MAHRSTPKSLLLTTAACVAAACSGGNTVSNASPRISEVPQQSVLGGTTFTIDLADYVTDREAGTLTYSVTSGGGAFTGSSYSNMFDTMGVYPVDYTVTDGTKTATGTFEVKVTSANLVVVREDTSGMLLLDSATNAFVRVTGSASTPSFAAGLGDGRTVYQLAGGEPQLWVFDPLTRSNQQLGAGQVGGATYKAKTSDNKVLFTAGESDAKHLFLWNPMTGLTRDIAQDLLDSANVMVNSADLVFYEVGVNGQPDVYAYDPSHDETFAVATEATAETLRATLPNGGVVFSRIGGGGESDLFYYRVATGLVEIGNDVSSIASWDKAFAGNGTGSQVVFTAQSGVVSDVYSWNPVDGQTTAISAEFTAGSYDLVSAIGAGNEVVLQRLVSGTEIDAYFYDLDDGVSGTVRNSNDVSAVLGVSSDGTTSWAIVRPSGTPTSLLAVSLIGTPTTQTWAAGGAVASSVHTLANGDVVSVRQDGAALNVFDISVGTWGTAITGTGLAFAGAGLDDGDFAYTLTNGGHTDLWMWDASATGSVVIDAATTDDTYQSSTANGTILFSRPVGTNSNADLFVWDGATATRLTSDDSAGLKHDYSVLGKFVGAR